MYQHYKSISGFMCNIVSMEPFDMTIKNCYEVTEKVVTPHGNGAKVLVPRGWIGKKVKVILIEAPDE